MVSEAANLANSFNKMVKEQQKDQLAMWIEKA
jgi:hypothetical protein